MRATRGASMGLIVCLAGCGALPPGSMQRPILLTTTDDGGPQTAPMPPGQPLMNAMAYTTTQLAGPVSPWAAGLIGFSANGLSGWGAQLLSGSWSNTGAMAQVSWPAPQGNAWSPISGMGAGGLGAALPTSMASTARAQLGLQSPPGWGTQGWGPSGGGQSTGLAGMGGMPAPGQYNLSRGATQIGGWGIDTGFFTIPQQAQHDQLESTLAQINASPNGRLSPMPTGMTSSAAASGPSQLDPRKYPYLHAIKGPLVPTK